MLGGSYLSFFQAALENGANAVLQRREAVKALWHASCITHHVRIFSPGNGRCSQPGHVLLVSPHKGDAFWLGTRVVEWVTAHQAFMIPGVPNPPPLGHLGFSLSETRFGGFFFASPLRLRQKKPAQGAGSLKP